MTNLYGFNNNLTWKNKRTKDVYTHDELSFVPKYLFEGLRVEEGKLFQKDGLSLELFSDYLLKNQLNKEIWNVPKLNENGKREWMVTTSEDVVTQENKSSYLMEEGDCYILKKPKNNTNKKFIGWLHTGENIMYQPGDKVEILYGTHFIAKYKEKRNEGEFGVQI